MSYSFSFQRFPQIQSTIRSTRSNTRRDDTESSSFKSSAPSPNETTPHGSLSERNIKSSPFRSDCTNPSWPPAIILRQRFSGVYQHSERTTFASFSSSSSEFRSCFLNFADLGTDYKSDKQGDDRHCFPRDRTDRSKRGRKWKSLDHSQLTGRISFVISDGAYVFKDI